MVKLTAARKSRVKKAVKNAANTKIKKSDAEWVRLPTENARRCNEEFERAVSERVVDRKCNFSTASEKIRELRYGTAHPQAEKNGLPSVAEVQQGANPKAAYGDMKVALHLLPPAMLVEASVAFKEGAIKYGAFNYRETKIELMTYVGAILRHCMAFIDGEDTDPDSILGKSHMSGILASAGIVCDAMENGNAIDNRPHKGTGTLLLKKWERAAPCVK